MAYIVAIDGPAGSGKGTVTELVAKKLGLVNIGSGSAYRCVALETINKGIDLKEKEKIINLLDEIEIEFKMENSKDIVYLNGKDVTSRIREKDVAKIVSFVSSIKEVRFKLNEIFKKCAKKQKCHYGRTRHRNICISKCRSKNIFRCYTRRKSKKKI